MKDEKFSFEPSFAQNRLWFIEQMNPGTALYNIPAAFELKGKLDLNAFEKALKSLVNRHESLRTSFTYSNEKPFQIIHEQAFFNLPMIDLSHIPEQDIEQEIQKRTQQENNLPFDLEKAPLFRTNLFKINPQRHIFMLTMHHIISDGWSKSIFFRDLFAFYQHYSQGKPLDLPQLELQYADYSEWQKQWLQGQVLKQQMHYWKNKLEQVPVLQLPTDCIRPSVRTYNGHVHYFNLDPQLSQKLAQLARQNDATLFMCLLAVYQVLLFRYTGQTDITVGSPIANRNRTEIENMIGFFINTLVLRADLTQNPDFNTFLHQIKQTTLQAYDHQDIPFEKLVEELQPERDLSLTPLFQVMFVLQNTPGTDYQLEELSFKRFDIPIDTAKFDLTLTFTETKAGLEGSLEYNTDLFHFETIKRFISHFENLARAIVEQPQEKVARYDFLAEQEKECLFKQWNNSETVFNSSTCLHQRFEEVVKKHAQNTALSFAGQSLTYEQLNQKANQLAFYLIEQGVKPETLVGLCMQRSNEMLIAILAILKAGGAYVPLDPDYPRERLNFCLNDSKMPFLITLEQYQQQFKHSPARIICLDQIKEQVNTMPLQNPNQNVLPQNLAYIIYTSGSTGLPKGVTVTHANVSRLFESTYDWFQFSSRDVWTMFHSFAFDFSVWEIWGALLYGGKLVIVSYLDSRSPERFYQLICREKVTSLSQTPSAFRQLIKAEQTLADQNEPLSLRVVVFGGEALEVGSLKDWFKKHSSKEVRLINMYGITETTVHVTYREITEKDLESVSISPIGIPLPDLQVYLLDQYQNPVPIGVIGEVYVGGGGVARGYLNRPQLTEERFIVDPYSRQKNARLYRSGDLARYNSQGELEYAGRADDQVKIRGFRIELGEIEAVLGQHEAVNEVLVLALQDSSNDKRLAAYLTAKKEAPSIEQLRSYLKEHLPDYMVPPAFVLLESFPLTANGKIDRKALPEPGQLRPALEQEYAAPRNQTEEILAAIWSEVLGVDQVGINDNYFTLGGDSLRSIQVIDRLKKREIHLTLYQLFQFQTIAELARIADSTQNQFDELKVEPFEMITAQDRQKLPPGIVDAYPLAALQAGMLYHMELTPDSSVYHCTGTSYIEIKEPFEKEAFLKAVQITVDQHDIFKTSFDLENYSQPLQLVHEKAVLPTVITDLRHLDEEAQQAEVEKLIENERKTPFDLTKPTLLRYFIQIFKDNGFQFTMTECHPIFDGWSYHSMIVEVFNRYEKIKKGIKLEEKKPLSIKYRDFVALEQRAIQSREHLDYWKQKLAGSTILKLPHEAETESRDRLPDLRDVKLIIDGEDYAGLKNMVRLASVPLKSVLLAAHMKVMNIATGVKDILIGQATNGRPESVDSHKLYGLFLNIVPYRLQLEPGTWLDLVRQAFENEREFLPHRRYPLAVIQQECGIRELVDEVLFNYMDFHVYEDLSQSLDFKVIAGKKGDKVHEGTNFTLTVHFQHLTLSSKLKRNQVGIDLAYDANKITRQQALKLRDYYQAVIKSMTRDPHAEHTRQNFLSRQDFDLLFKQWNNTYKDYSYGQCLHYLIEKQVLKNPDHTAVKFQDQSLTYEQLNQKANQLAFYLIEQGIGPGSFVGICMNRSLEMLLAMLAVLKAGAAYVPFDPEYPGERLRFMFEDTKPGFMLTQQQFKEIMPCSPSLSLDTQWPDISHYSSANPVHQNKPADNAYLIYTSGSTGKPKGVMIKHQSIVNRLCWMQDEYQLEKSESVLQKTPYSFDVSVWEFFWPLITGACLVISPPDAHRDPGQLISLIIKNHITTIHFVPSMLQLFLDDQDVKQCQSLKRVISSGESLTRSLQDQFFQNFDSTELHNLYGPTEAAIDVTYWACQKNEARQFIPIGKPIANNRLYVLNDDLQPLPIGAVGELHIAGIQIARGYLNREQLSQEKFITNPFQSNPEQLMYKTGDLVRWHRDGVLEFIQRKDNQVKIAGFRIELGEIEANLNSHPAIQKTVVLLNNEINGEKKIIAYYTLQEEQEIEMESLKKYLKTQLPLYMIPHYFVLMPEFPLTVNGKIDHKKLPVPDIKAALKQYIAPENNIQQEIADIWQNTLNIDQIGINDNFFNIGGNSLQLIRIHSRLIRLLNSEYSLRYFFEHATIAELSLLAEDNTAQEFDPSQITAISRNKKIPLSSAQERLWMLDKMNPESVFYNITHIERYLTTIDHNIMQKTINTLVERHEILRTNIKTEADIPLQVIKDQKDSALAYLDLSRSGAEQRDQEINQLIKQRLNQPFDLEKETLFRVCLVKRADNDYLLILVFHHIIFDEWSTALFIQELQTVYLALIENKNPDLPELEFQYADYAFWQRNYLKTNALEEQIEYWQEKLGHNLPLMQLPLDWKRPAVQSYQGANLSFQINPVISRKAAQFCIDQHLTPFMFFLSAFKILLHHYCQQDDVVIGTPVANRQTMDTEKMIGFFVNTLALRTDLSGEPDFIELVKRVRNVVLEGLMYQDIPFDQLVEILQPQRDPSYSPIFQIMFVYQNKDKPDSDSEKLKKTNIIPIDSEYKTSKFDLTLIMGEDDQGFSGSIEFNTDLFQPASINRLTAHFEQLLKSILNQPQQPISKFSLLPQPELDLIEKWNKTGNEYPAAFSIAQQFQAQVEKFPLQTALIWHEEKYNYQQLNQKANQLAHYLKKQGVKANAPVGICCQRNPNMIIAILAILKAGGCYVPFDVEYPIKRLQYMFQDTNVALLITEKATQKKIKLTHHNMIHLDEDWPSIRNESKENLPVDTDGEALAYIMYTSGSTGVPKGVLVRQKSVLRLVIEPNYIHLDQSEKILHISPISFDASTLEIWGALLNGGCCVLYPEQHLTTIRLEEVIRENRITTMWITNSLFNSIIDDAAHILSPLKQIATGGEALSVIHICRAKKKLPHTRLINGYGPTENTTFTNCYTIPDQVNEKWLSIPIGPPISNTQVYILNHQLNPVPIGIPGQLYIAGDGLAKGYLNQPGLTNEKFLPDPFKEGKKMYATGDLVRWLPNGCVEFISRIDEQVKIRGFRIEPREIEICINHHSLVKNCAVMVRKDQNNSRKIAAYIILEHKADMDQIKQHVKENLPDYMMPAAFVEMHDFPLTANGKIDLKNLPAPDLETKNQALILPENHLEKQIAAVWREVLNYERISIHHNFFDLGGHSILLTRVHSRLNKILEQPVNIVDLFRFPTINSLAQYILSMSKQDEKDNREEIKQKMSQGQNRLAQLLKRKKNR